MGLEQKTVGEVVKDAVRGAFDIPEFQRGFVWRTDQVRDLLDSLYRDYPIGAMLVWDSSDYEVPRTAHGAPRLQWIVDGQQRTTALCIAFGSKPYWWPDASSWNQLVDRIDVLVNFSSTARELEFALANPVRRRDPNWVSVRRVLRCETDQEATMLGFQIAAERGETPPSPEVARTISIANTLWQFRNREVPLVSVQHEIEDVAEIFARLNRSGTQVTEADVTVALIAASNPGWVRDELLSFSRDLSDSGYDLDPGVYIRTLTGIARGTARLADVPSSFWREEVTQIWGQAKAAISQSVRLLWDRGLLSAQLLPSRNSLVPLFVFQAQFGERFPFDRLFHWFLLANADGRYSGAATTSLTQDLTTIQKAQDGPAAIQELHQRLRLPSTIEDARFLEYYNRDRFGRLLLYLLLFDGQATDWVSDVRIGYSRDSNALNEGFLPEWHHIFPRAVLRRAGRNEGDLNFLANITVLTEATNRNRLRAKPPVRYVNDYGITEEQLRQHFVPGVDYLGLDRYDDFIAERSRLLGCAANSYLQRLCGA